jgi:hypothetical protein
LLKLAGLSFADAMAEANSFLAYGNVTGALRVVSELKYLSSRTRAIRELLDGFLATSPTDEQLVEWFEAFEPDGALAGDASLVHGESGALLGHLSRQPSDKLVSLLTALENPAATLLLANALYNQSKRDPAVFEKLKPLSEDLRGLVLAQTAQDSQHLEATEFGKNLASWNVPEHEREGYWQAWARGKRGLPSEALFSEAESVASPSVRETLRVLAYQRWLREDSLAASEAIRKNAAVMPARSYDLLLVDLVDIAKSDKDPVAARAWAGTARTEEMRQFFHRHLGFPKLEEEKKRGAGP